MAAEPINQNDSYKQWSPAVSKGRLVKLTLTIANFTAGGLTETEPALDLLPYEYIKSLLYYVKVPFTGGTVATVTLTAKNAAGTTIAAAKSIFTDEQAWYTPITTGIVIPAFAGENDRLDFLLTTTVGDINELTAGEVWVLVEVGAVPEFLRSANS